MNSRSEIIAGCATGWIATIELSRAGRRVFAMKLEPNRGLTGLFIDPQPPRRVGAHDATALMLSDWMGMTGFNRDADFRLRRLSGCGGNGDIPVPSPSGQPLLGLYATSETNGFAGGGLPSCRTQQDRPRGGYAVFGRTVGDAVVGSGA